MKTFFGPKGGSPTPVKQMLTIKHPGAAMHGDKLQVLIWHRMYFYWLIIILQMFISNFMDEIFFFSSPLDRNFCKGKVHTFYFLYVFPQTVLQARDSINIMHWLTTWTLLIRRLTLNGRCRNKHRKKFETPISSTHTPPLPPTSPFSRAFVVLDILSRSRHSSDYQTTLYKAIWSLVQWVSN